MVFEEFIVEVISYRIWFLLFYEGSLFDFNVEGVLNKAKILCEMFYSEGNLQKFDKTICDIIMEVFSFGDKNHVLLTDRKSRVWDACFAHIDIVFCVGENQSGFVNGVSTKHTTNGVGDEFFDGITA